MDQEFDLSTEAEGVQITKSDEDRQLFELSYENHKYKAKFSHDVMRQMEKELGENILPLIRRLIQGNLGFGDCETILRLGMCEASSKFKEKDVEYQERLVRKIIDEIGILTTGTFIAGAVTASMPELTRQAEEAESKEAKKKKKDKPSTTNSGFKTPSTAGSELKSIGS